MRMKRQVFAVFGLKINLRYGGWYSAVPAIQ